MKLSDQKVLESLLDAVQRSSEKKKISRVTRSAAIQSALTPSRENALRTQACPCGVCRTCEENARWERIFTAKFADPTYYSRPIEIPRRSSLSGA